MLPLLERSPDRRASLHGHRGTSLLLVSILGLIAVCGLLAWAWATVNPIIRTVGGIQDSALPSLDLIQKAKYADLEASVVLRNALLIADPTKSAAEMRRYEGQHLLAAKALESLKVATTRLEGAKLLEAVFEARRRLVGVRLSASERERQSWVEASGATSTDAITLKLQAALDGYLQPLQALYAYEEGRIGSSVGSTRAEADLVWWLLILSGGTAAITLLFITFAWRLEIRREVGKRDEQIAVLNDQRRTLVREVHHRIKNHLQGLLSLIENYRGTRGTDNETLWTLHGHVLALVGIHGLQSRRSAEAVSLGELVREQLRLIETGFPGAQLSLTDQPGFEHFALIADHATPVALVITELIVNAVKHGAPTPVVIELIFSNNEASVSVTNQLVNPLPADWKSRSGHGAGLALVESLIQGIGRIKDVTQDERLTMTVELHGPLLN